MHLVSFSPLFRAALCLWLVGAAPLAAQTGQTGVIEGRVSLANGRAIANAAITVRLLDGTRPREVRTDETGSYRVHFLPPGAYAVEARLVGFAPTLIEPVRVQSVEVRRVDLVLTPSRGTELAPITIAAAPEPGELVGHEFTRTLSAAERDRLPGPRDVNGLLGFFPGMRPDQVYGGSTSQANLYQLDGVMVNQPGTGGSFLLPNVDWVEELKVIGPAAGAEHGNFQGGLVNIVTKSGSNTRQGQLRTLYEGRALGRSSATPFAQGDELEGRLETTGEIRGPIVRDRLFYYLAGSQSTATRRVVDAATGSPRDLVWLADRPERVERKGYAKLTWQQSAADIVNVAVGYDEVRRERVGLTGFTAPEATLRGRSPSVFMQGNWQRTISNTRFLELKYSGFTGRDDELPYNGVDQPSVSLLDRPNTPTFSNAIFSRRNAPSSHALSAAYDVYTMTGPVRHRVKLGAEYTMGRWREERTRNGGLSWYTEAGDDFDARNPATWQTIPSLGVYATADTGGRIDLAADSRNAALYVQDYLDIGRRLRVSAGLRLGQWQGLLTPPRGDQRAVDALSATALDPRLGATVDLFANGRTVGTAHWGRYRQHLFALFYDRAPGANAFTNIDYCDWNDPTGTQRPVLGERFTPAQFSQRFTCFPGPNLATSAERVERYRQPYVDQLTLGFEQAFGARWRGEVLFLARRNGNILALVDRARDANWVPITNVRVSDARGPVLDPDGAPVVLPQLFARADDVRARLRAGDAIPGFSVADTLRLMVDQTLVLRRVDEARRDFRQLQLGVTGVLPRAQVHAAVAFTQLTGNVFSVNGYADPLGLGNGPFVEPNDAINFNGRLPNWSPWDARVRLTGALPWGLEGGLFLLAQAGEYWTPTLTVDRTLGYATELADGTLLPLSSGLFQNAAGQAVRLESQGSRRLPARATVDLRLQKVLPVRAHELVVGVEAFNLLNAQAITARNPEVRNQDPADPTSLAGAARLRQAPSAFRLQVQVRR